MARVEKPAVEYSDEELLARLRKGDHGLFGTLVRRFQQELYAYLLRYTGDAQLAEDVFQNTFLQVYLKVEQYEPGRPVQPWIYRIATNQAIDLLRSLKRHNAASLEQVQSADADGPVSLMDLVAETDPGPPDRVLMAESRTLVRAAIGQLPEMLRGVVVLAYFQELKYTEIAEILDIPVGTVKSRLHNALHRLRAIWDEAHSGEVPETKVERTPQPLTASPR